MPESGATWGGTIAELRFDQDRRVAPSAPPRRRGRLVPATAAAVAIAAIAAVTLGTSAASAVGSPSSPSYLGTAQSFSVLGGTTVTNAVVSTGAATSLSGDVGVSPGTAITGFPPGHYGGAIHDADATAANAQQAVTAAYLDAAGLTPTTTAQYSDLTGLTLSPGVYNATTSMALNGRLVLDGHGDPNASWVFQAGSTLTTASASQVSVINGNPCNVYWQTGSSATLGTGSAFIGTILAHVAITATTNASVAGRLLAQTAAVTLDSNQIGAANCTLTDASGVPIVTPSPSASASASPSATPRPSRSATPRATPTPSRSASPTPRASASATPSPSSSTSAASGTSTGSTSSGSGGSTASGRTSSGSGSSASGRTGSATGSGSAASLAETGSDVLPQIWFGVVAVVLGFVVFFSVATRHLVRRRSERNRHG